MHRVIIVLNTIEAVVIVICGAAAFMGLVAIGALLAPVFVNALMGMI